MGMIKIETVGSFPNQTKTFSAMQHGHADAVAKAITWLSDEMLPRAIRQDHNLHDQNERPEGPFGSKGNL
jgi:hypothetical protein